ncbi:hypothetical protein LIER_10117 [Lithospermum erythrorhizon]|uniref:R13L1/DRL21-like LRR repeat region domain-containing protein n=1 Tax=Lithospermum erythrorhizon TaxID=34254 RepID=A0AAV3PL12_LITER
MGIGCNNLHEVPNSSSSTTTFFPKLVHFAILHCDELKEWEDLTQTEENTINVMPKLKILHIENCPKLEVLPRLLLHKASCLSNLSINLSEQFSIGKLKEVPNVYFWKKRSFMGPKFPSLMTVLDNLAEVEIIGAENVLSLPPLGMLPSLEKLKLEGLSLLKFIGREFWGTNNSVVDTGSRWPSSVAAFPKLVQFILNDCHELEELAEIDQEQEQH